MTMEEFYKRVGGDYELTVQRLSNEGLLRKFIVKFLSEPSFSQLQTAVAAEDVLAAFRAAHTLKGVAASLGFGDLKRAAFLITETLRGGQLPKKGEMEELELFYQTVLSCIETLDEANENTTAESVS